MADPRRRPWTDADTRALIDLWPRVSSIVLIALELGRSSSSVQTQASRRGLPRRTEGNERHRRKWTAADLVRLDESVAARRDGEGRIMICEVADEVGRSIDAIAARLSEAMGGEEALFAAIVVTRKVSSKVPAAAPAGGGAPARKSRFPGKIECLSCKKVFWSEGVWNRMCSSCKKDEGGSDWDW
jgi:hypothetical protein